MTPAVVINTTDPVVIQNCTIRSKAALIHVAVGNAHVTVRNCRGYGLDPNVAGQTRGDFFFAYKIGSLALEHNYMEAVNFGVRLYSQNGWQPNGPILVRYNQAKNLDGAPSDGMGGRDLSNLQFGQDNGNHFVILANLQKLSGVEIAWNEIIHEPTTSSIGDIINMFSSSGTSATPIMIHDNYIQGGYAAIPTATNYVAGGITMDGSSTDTAATATAFVKIHGNQIVNHANFGVGIAAGHDNEAYGNRAVSSGQLFDGTWIATTYGSGIYVWNCTCYNQPPTVYFNNVAHDNTVGWLIEGADPDHPGGRVPPPFRNDYYLPDCQAGQCVNNASLGDPVTNATEAAEMTVWQQKLSANGIKVGPTTAVTSINPNGGTITGGMTVTIVGTNFVTPATLSLGGTAATAVSVVSPTTITATTPAHVAGVVDVVVDSNSQTATLSGGYFYFMPPPPGNFFTLVPCRLVDTRNPLGPLGGPALVASARRNFTVTSVCNIPTTAKAIAVSLAVTEAAVPGFVTLFPGNGIPSLTSSINFSTGQTRANNAVVLLATDGTGTLAVRNGAAGAVHLILDVNGYFE